MATLLRAAGYPGTAGGRGAMRGTPLANSPCLVIVSGANPRVAQQLFPLSGKYAAPILIIVSGRFRRGLARSAEPAHRLGVRRVLPKPFTRKELLSAVHELLDPS